jgi:hypothetical protein
MPALRKARTSHASRPDRLAAIARKLVPPLRFAKDEVSSKGPRPASAAPVAAAAPVPVLR